MYGRLYIFLGYHFQIFEEIPNREVPSRTSFQVGVIFGGRVGDDPKQLTSATQQFLCNQ